MKIKDFVKSVGGTSDPIPVEIRRGHKLIDKKTSLRNLELFGGDLLEEKVAFLTIKRECITIQVKTPK